MRSPIATSSFATVFFVSDFRSRERKPPDSFMSVGQGNGALLISPRGEVVLFGRWRQDVAVNPSLISSNLA